MQDSIQVHLKGGKGPIMVLTCDIGSGDVAAERSSCFSTLEESRIKTSTLHTGTSRTFRAETLKLIHVDSQRRFISYKTVKFSLLNSVLQL